MEIKLQALNLHRGGKQVLRDISWWLKPGERWLIVGRSGAGKTQLLKVLAGDVWPDDAPEPTRHYKVGRQWHDQPVGVRDAIAWLGPERQDRYEHYDWNFSALEVVGTGLQRSDIPQQPLSAQQRAQCRALLRRAGCLRLAARKFLTLSYGERRLVLLARALAWDAGVLLLDEVATGLDTRNRQQLFRLLAGRTFSKRVWVASAHRMDDVPPAANRLLWLQAGAVRYQGRMDLTVLREALATEPVAQPRKSKAIKPRGRTKLVELQAASVWIDSKRVLRNIDWTVRSGECWVVHGSNGAGKSTFLRTLYGDHAVADDGSIRRAGVVAGVPLDDFRRRTGLIAPHLQTDYARHYTVLETVVSGLYSSIGLNFSATPTEQRRAMVSLRSVDMQDHATRTLGELSYGQVRRVLFARAGVLRPKLMLLDEPFTGLNAEVRAQLQVTVEQWVAQGIAVVIASHYRNEWPRNATHELVLTRGQLRYAGVIRA